MNTLTNHINALKPVWMSEHLSFNAFYDGDTLVNTNFLLPQVQNLDGIETAVKVISRYRDAIDLPFAFETGVNYLKPLENEMPDGQFIAEISERADCSILLDVHNVMTNQINGRQPVEEFINQLPLERVSEIHMAGGFFYGNYYLDAHSGISTEELITLANEIIQDLPNLKLITFEMLPEYLPALSEGDFEKQIEAMEKLWDIRGRNCRSHTPIMKVQPVDVKNKIQVKDWEYTLGKLCIGDEVKDSELADHLRSDGGTILINELIFHFRASAIVSSLKLSSRLIRLSMGNNLFEKFLNNFFRSSKPDLFPFRVALKFSDFVRSANLEIPFLMDLLTFEIATIQTLSDEMTREVNFSYNPFPVIRSLNEDRIPEDQKDPVKFVITIKPDDAFNDAEIMALNSVLHN